MLTTTGGAVLLLTTFFKKEGTKMNQTNKNEHAKKICVDIDRLTEEYES